MLFRCADGFWMPPSLHCISCSGDTWRIGLNSLIRDVCYRASELRLLKAGNAQKLRAAVFMVKFTEPLQLATSATRSVNREYQNKLRWGWTETALPWCAQSISWSGDTWRMILRFSSRHSPPGDCQRNRCTLESNKTKSSDKLVRDLKGSVPRSAGVSTKRFDERRFDDKLMNYGCSKRSIRNSLLVPSRDVATAVNFCWF